MKHHLPACLGLGFGLYALLWIPILNLFLVPVAVVAGTLLFSQLEQMWISIEAIPRGD